MYLWHYQLKDIQYKIRCFFFPKHQTIRKVIPRTWVDKDELFRLISFALITDYFYKEVGGKEKLDEQIAYFKDELVNPNEQGKVCLSSQLEFYKKLKEWIQWIEQTRPSKEKDLEESWPEWPVGMDFLEAMKSDTRSFEEKYGRTNALEKEIELGDTKVLHELVANRFLLWT